MVLTAIGCANTLWWEKALPKTQYAATWGINGQAFKCTRVLFFKLLGLIKPQWLTP